MVIYTVGSDLYSLVNPYISICYSLVWTAYIDTLIIGVVIKLRGINGGHYLIDESVLVLEI